MLILLSVPIASLDQKRSVARLWAVRVVGTVLRRFVPVSAYQVSRQKILRGAHRVAEAVSQDPKYIVAETLAASDFLSLAQEIVRTALIPVSKVSFGEKLLHRIMCA